ncbi:hypothetical protein KL949_003851 [Ogataea haglerorum]|nr:hypothetical protein KL949_003851 [Ogataea haglerorum]KAG7765741.1 hypothetical protein KL931_004392 [Ogataea haglerorum]
MAYSMTVVFRAFVHAGARGNQASARRHHILQRDSVRARQLDSGAPDIRVPVSLPDNDPDLLLEQARGDVSLSVFLIAHHVLRHRTGDSERIFHLPGYFVLNSIWSRQLLENGPVLPTLHCDTDADIDS